MAKIDSYVYEQEALERDFPQPIEQDLLDKDPAYIEFMKATETNVEVNCEHNRAAKSPF